MKQSDLIKVVAGMVCFIALTNFFLAHSHHSPERARPTSLARTLECVCSELDGYVITGTALEHVPPGSQGCCKACSKLEACMFWTKTSTGMCDLFGTGSKFTAATASAQIQTKSGMVSCEHAPNANVVASYRLANPVTAMQAKPIDPSSGSRPTKKLDHLKALIANKEPVVIAPVSADAIAKTPSKTKKSSKAAGKGIRLNSENAELIEPIDYTAYMDSLEGVTDNVRRQLIVRSGIHQAWSAYKQHCWGKDDLKPVSRTCNNWLGGNGNTLIDSLSTLYVSGLHKEFAGARDWVRDTLDFDNTHAAVSHFETVIRLLGGLISSYDLSGDPVFLAKAIDLGERMAHVFSGAGGLPKGKVNYGKSRTATGGNRVGLAEIGTIQMEYLALSERSGRPEFGARAQKVTDWLESKSGPFPGLLPTLVNSDRGTFIGNRVSFGGDSDSFYEYLVKVWVLTGKKLDQYKRMYSTAVKSMHQKLIRKSGNITYIDKVPQEGKMGHLECFVGGMLVLGVASGCDTEDTTLSKKVGAELSETCYQGYAQTKTGVGGDLMSFHGGKVSAANAQYYGRPESSESVYYMWKTTKDPVWREKAWRMFTALEKHTRVESGGYTDIGNVNQIPSPKSNNQNSFFISETLKYLYLIFCDDDVLPLKGIDEDKYERMYVLNTEAQPILAWGYDN